MFKKLFLMFTCPILKSCHRLGVSICENSRVQLRDRERNLSRAIDFLGASSYEAFALASSEAPAQWVYGLWSAANELSCL